MASRKDGVGAARMKAVELMVVGAVDGTSPRTLHGFGIETLDLDDVGRGRPRPAPGIHFGKSPSHQPARRPAGILRNHDGVRRTVEDVGESRRLLWMEIVNLSTHDPSGVFRSVNESQVNECIDD